MAGVTHASLVPTLGCATDARRSGAVPLDAADALVGLLLRSRCPQGAGPRGARQHLCGITVARIGDVAHLRTCAKIPSANRVNIAITEVLAIAILPPCATFVSGRPSAGDSESSPFGSSR